jgi:hypothetical protein
MLGNDALGRSMSAVIVPLSVALLVVVTVLRLAVSNPIEAVGFLYVIPISLLASERGWRGGLYGAAGAVGLTIVWAVVQHVPLGARPRRPCRTRGAPRVVGDTAATSVGGSVAR